ncbi:MAG TPA: MBOAT family protein [Bacteroidetes bacterium]|nr:MBOAT family protein [Bacteroidota bacterium]
MEILKDIFAYSKDSPLIFTQFYFWGFFAAVLLVFSFIYPFRAVRNAFLFLVSIFFYYKTSSFFFVILLFSTIVDYFIGFGIHKAKRKANKTFWLVLSIVVNLLVLSYFKYSYFFTESFNYAFESQIPYFNHFNYWVNEFTGSKFSVTRLLPPVGISFFTFQTISYAVDVYKGKIKPVRNILDFGFYVSFFPQLVAGPIVRASEFIPQIYESYHLSKQEFGIAIFWILKGLLKKFILADYIAVNFVDRVFDNPELFTGFENLMGLYGYSLQVYADFSGYTDIAIGVALLMGFRLPVNFNSPYKSRSVGEFWKRWHISLSTWLKDYLYFPLGGSRGSSFLTWVFYALIPIVAIGILGITYLPAVIFSSVGLVLLFMYLDFRVPRTKIELATAANLMLTMLLGGLWHGASWMFVIWGALNGIGLVFFKFWRKISPWEGKKQWYWTVWTIFLTFSFITFTRIWFRSPDLATANLVMGQIWYNFGAEHILEVLSNYASVFYVMFVGMVTHWWPDKQKLAIRKSFVDLHVTLKVIVVVIVVFVSYQAISSDLQAFIYFQF